jgi:tetratricopeptide (TPR) repeat protein
MGVTLSARARLWAAGSLGRSALAAGALMILLAGCGSATYLVPAGGSPPARGYAQAAEIHWTAEQADVNRAAYDEEKAILKDPTWPVPYARLSEILLAANHRAGALQEAELAHNVAPRRELYANNLGDLALELGHWRLAASTFEAALKLHPTDWVAAVGLGRVGIRHHDWQAALRNLHNALLWGGPRGPVYDAFGEYYWRKLNYAAAGYYYADAQSADPGWWQPYYDLAQVDLKLGEPSAALNNLATALRLSPTQSEVFQQYQEVKQSMARPTAQSAG